MTTPTASRTDTEEHDMTTTAPSPEAFLAAPSDPDEDDETPETEPNRFTANPDSITYSQAEWRAANPPLVTEQNPPSDPLTSIADSLERLVIIGADIRSAGRAVPSDDLARQEFAALEEAYRFVEQQRDETQSLVEQVLELIKPSTSKLSNQVRALLKPPVAPAPETTTEPEAPPANDAPIEDWLAYAQARGLEVDPGRTNRSQIRTLLGISQPVEGES